MRRSPCGRPGRSRLFRSAAALPYLTISSAILIPYTFGSFISRVVGGRSAATEPISSRHLRSFPPGAFIASVSPGFRVGARRPPNGLMNAVPSRPRVSAVRRLARQRIRMPPSLVSIVRVSDGAFVRKYQGVSHAKWPKAKHECAPTQTGSVICCPLKAVDIECRPPRAHRPSKCAKKLRAVSGARPH
jgi:hypothetical protein